MTCVASFSGGTVARAAGGPFLAVAETSIRTRGLVQRWTHPRAVRETRRRRVWPGAVPCLDGNAASLICPRAAQLTTNEVRSEPAAPQETSIGQRPGVVRVPTVHVQEIRPPFARFG